MDQGDILYQILALASLSAVEMWLQNAINVLGNRYDSARTHWMCVPEKKIVKNVAWTICTLRKTIHDIKNFFYEVAIVFYYQVAIATYY